MESDILETGVSQVFSPPVSRLRWSVVALGWL